MCTRASDQPLRFGGVEVARGVGRWAVKGAVEQRGRRVSAGYRASAASARATKRQPGPGRARIGPTCTRASASVEVISGLEATEAHKDGRLKGAF